ncbi:MAG: chemotaxis response regulator protein-glutamate methylesterase, partial [Ignavibacteria bacterium]
MLKDKTKILIVDDSAFMRKSLEIMLSEEPSFEIVGKAKDGLDALELVQKLNPDVITMDIEMPRMDGLTAVKKIMDTNPIPIIMISSLTTEGAEATIKAMEYGAVDFIPKEFSFVNMNISSIRDDLIQKIKVFARKANYRNRGNVNHRITKTSVSQKFNGKASAVAIGISTGGPLTLQKIIPSLENISSPIFLVQHMPPNFTKTLAERLDKLTTLKVKEAENGEIVQRGHVYVAPGGKQMHISKNGVGEKIVISDQPADKIHKPSVDVMIESAAEQYQRKLLCIIMTGMGKDGLEGVKYAKEKGAYCVAQDESTSVIYGMPKAIVDNSLADRVLPMQQI